MKATGKIVLGVVAALLGISAVGNGIAEQIKPKKADDDTTETPVVETSTTTTENP